MSYKDKTVSLGYSDIASLVLRSWDQLIEMNMHIDSTYCAYIIGEDDEVPSHYKLAHTFTSWLTIYDDEKARFKLYADKIEVYRAGDCGVLIKTYGEDSPF